MISLGRTCSACFATASMSIELVLAPHGVVRSLEPFAGHVDRRTMGEMPAGGENRGPMKVSPGCSSAQKHRLVHLAAGVGLHNWRTRRRTASLARSIASVSGDVDPFAAAIVARAPDNPRRICWSITEPCASSTARETMFSDAISSISWRLSAKFALDRGPRSQDRPRSASL